MHMGSVSQHVVFRKWESSLVARGRHISLFGFNTTCFLYYDTQASSFWGKTFLEQSLKLV